MHIYPFELIKRDPGEGFPSGYIFPDSTPELARKALYGHLELLSRISFAGMVPNGPF